MFLTREDQTGRDDRGHSAPRSILKRLTREGEENVTPTASRCGKPFFRHDLDDFASTNKSEMSLHASTELSLGVTDDVNHNTQFVDKKGGSPVFNPPSRVAPTKLTKLISSEATPVVHVSPPAIPHTPAYIPTPAFDADAVRALVTPMLTPLLVRIATLESELAQVKATTATTTPAPQIDAETLLTLRMLPGRVSLLEGQTTMLQQTVTQTQSALILQQATALAAVMGSSSSAATPVMMAASAAAVPTSFTPTAATSMVRGASFASLPTQQIIQQQQQHQHAHDVVVSPVLNISHAITTGSPLPVSAVQSIASSCQPTPQQQEEQHVEEVEATPICTPTRPTLLPVEVKISSASSILHLEMSPNYTIREEEVEEEDENVDTAARAEVDANTNYETGDVEEHNSAVENEEEEDEEECEEEEFESETQSVMHMIVSPSTPIHMQVGPSMSSVSYPSARTPVAPCGDAEDDLPQPEPSETMNETRSTIANHGDGNDYLAPLEEPNSPSSSFAAIFGNGAPSNTLVGHIGGVGGMAAPPQYEDLTPRYNPNPTPTLSYQTDHQPAYEEEEENGNRGIDVPYYEGVEENYEEEEGANQYGDETQYDDVQHDGSASMNNTDNYTHDDNSYYNHTADFQNTTTTANDNLEAYEDTTAPSRTPAEREYHMRCLATLSNYDFFHPLRAMRERERMLASSVVASTLVGRDDRPGERSLLTFADGRMEAVFESGLRKVKWACGHVTVMFANGDIKETMPVNDPNYDTVSAYYYATERTVQIKMVTGETLLRFASGQREMHDASGNIEVVVDPEGNEEVPDAL